MFFVFFYIFKASQNEEKQTKRQHSAQPPPLAGKLLFLFLYECRDGGRGEGLDVERLGHGLAINADGVTKYFQSASFFSDFLVSEK